MRLKKLAIAEKNPPDPELLFGAAPGSFIVPFELPLPESEPLLPALALLPEPLPDACTGIGLVPFSRTFESSAFRVPKVSVAVVFIRKY